MKKSLLAALAASASMGLAISAYAEEASEKSNTKYHDNGGYETTSSSQKTNAAGTTSSTNSSVNVDVDSKGNVSREAKSETTTDPEGLMNKKTDNAESEIEEKPRGGYKQTTTRSHKDADGTNVYFKTVTDVDVDSSGNVTTTAKTEKTVDPKGFFNKTTSTSTTKSVNGRIVKSDSKAN